MGIRAVVLGAALLMTACGSKQSTGTLPAGAAEELPEEPATIAVSASAPVTLKPDEDREDDVPDEDRRERERRDVRMLSYEDAMALAVEIGDASIDGGETQLTGEEIARFMDDHLDDMYEECIKKELRRGNELGTVTIDLAIRGKDGMVLGTTIEPGRRRFKKCIEDYLEEIRFPTFGSARMGARYRFHTD